MFTCTKNILSPQDGIIITLHEVPDDLFSDKILGDGFAIIPHDNKVFSPVNGEIFQIAETKHAFYIKSEDGLDILIHMGIDTVNLKGKGFDCNVKVGQKVKVGDLLATEDFNVMREGGFSCHTIFVITNMKIVKEVEVHEGEAKKLETVALSYDLV